MSSQIAFGLERAAWPALLVDERGAILRANPAAITAFGSIVTGDNPMLSVIWSGDNGVPVGAWALARGLVFPAFATPR